MFWFRPVLVLVGGQCWWLCFAKLVPQNELCWKGEYVSRSDCCNVQRYGPFGNQACWTDGFTFGLCCNDNPEASEQLRLIRDGLNYALAVTIDMSEAFQDQEGAIQINADPVTIRWAVNQSALSTAGPVATLAAVIRALYPRLTKGSADEAFATFLAMERPLFAHLDSGYPVFALFALLAHKRQRGQRLAEGAALPENATEPGAATRRWCLRGCVGAKAKAGDCV
mmetsp:Transcript_111487/g.347518  ORF Transcript_111487/g.347518 Transcript_111487/m.347518 type:complete len:225 (-) Transcript_111487:10-684(-)